ncbi:hypothetical protein CTEN210_00574 [Chaetoceros tenuissimus]|uniref:Uncharacterized protein n=1 Tax=Chaetoceros tenuissimus TaxID=426638 RepID=A0AAD3CGB2_9STRA|nr:hypothetical protein CTEN210_00574 [Chaetoceros tenuissimus]
MNISTLQSNLDFIKNLYFREEWKDEKCRNEILEALEEANEKIEKAFGDSLQRLYDHKPSVEAVEKVVKKFPSTLSCENEIGGLPIQRAAASAGCEYVPILAKEGMRHEVGGENTRGGLLKIDLLRNKGLNTLQWLVRVRGDGGDRDAKRLRVMKELWNLGLLVKNYIQEYKLLRQSWRLNKKRVEYLISWDLNALFETTRVGDKPLIHCISSSKCEESIAMVLKAGFDYFSNIGGLLFTEDDHGTTVFDCLCNKHGMEKATSFLHDVLSPKRDYPILHHIFVKAPQHKDIFMKKFPWAYHLKDNSGRTLQQAVLAAGPDVMNANDILLATLTDNQIQTKDPITTLYPFAAMAVGENADLEQCYYLLRRQPSVMDKRSRAGTIHRRKRRKL